MNDRVLPEIHLILCNRAVRASSSAPPTPWRWGRRVPSSPARRIARTVPPVRPIAPMGPSPSDTKSSGVVRR